MLKIRLETYNGQKLMYYNSSLENFSPVIIKNSNDKSFLDPKKNL
jgi:hypothetical protein